MDSSTIIGILSLVIGVLSIAVAVFPWWRNRKLFAYELIADSSLFLGGSPDGESPDGKSSDGKSAVEGQAEITYKKEPVKSMSFIHLRFYNRGYASIASSDFEKELNIILERRSGKSDKALQIISLKIGCCQPKDLVPQFKRLKNNGVSISPLLLNRGDFFDLELVVDGEKPILSVTGRIIGVKEIPKITKRKLPRGFWITAGLGVASMSIGGYAAYLFPPSSYGVLLLFAASAFCFGCAISLYKNIGVKTLNSRS